MHFTIRGENVEVTTALRTYIEDKVSKIERYFDDRVQANAHINLKIHGPMKKKLLKEAFPVLKTLN